MKLSRRMVIRSDDISESNVFDDEFNNLTQKSKFRIL